ncbi:MAG: transposase [Candidatus Cloacimonetes bacterium]|nr:transposase [Candidatus Cloacimonadota bacterium]
MNFEEGHFFHIYGRANSNYEILFKEEANYFFFLKKYQEYLSLFFHTICYCLLPNHFHFLVKAVYLSDLKDEKYKEIENYTKNKFKPDRFSKPVRFEEVELEFSNFLVQKISNFLNCYTKSFNKVYNRRGSLFQRPTKSKHISSENYLQRVVRYIHCNPQKHKYINEIENWQFSSYPDYVGLPLKPDRFKVIFWKPDRFKVNCLLTI